MTYSLSNVICIHAHAPDLGFLNGVRNFLSKSLGANFLGYRLGDVPSHSDAKRSIAEAGPKFIIIFAHGGVDYIRGGEYFDRMSSETRVIDRFLERNEVNIFRGKVVFCMSCQSFGLAAHSIEAGAIAFISFDQIPFHRLDVHENVISNRDFSKKAQTLIAGAVQFTLERFISGRVTLKQAVELTRFWICQNTIKFVRDPKNGNDRHDIAAFLLRVKNGISYHGSTDVRFVQNNG